MNYRTGQKVITIDLVPPRSLEFFNGALEPYYLKIGDVVTIKTVHSHLLEIEHKGNPLFVPKTSAVPNNKFFRRLYGIKE